MKINYYLVTNSLLSGLLACLVSISVKLTFTDYNLHFIDQKSNSQTSYLVILLIRCIFFASSFILNAFMWIFYTKSLQLSSNTLLATSFNKLSNFICSALFGILLFNENLKYTWFIGIAFITCGIFILNKSETRTKND